MLVEQKAVVATGAFLGIGASLVKGSKGRRAHESPKKISFRDKLP